MKIHVLCPNCRWTGKRKEYTALWTRCPRCRHEVVATESRSLWQPIKEFEFLARRER